MSILTLSHNHDLQKIMTYSHNYEIESYSITVRLIKDMFIS